MKKITYYIIFLFNCVLSTSVFAMSFQQVTSINFKLNSSGVGAYNKLLLNDVAKILKKNPTAKIMLVGNTDGTSNKRHSTYNYTLAKKRVKSIEAYLLAKHAIPASNIKTTAFADVPTLCNSPLNSVLGRRVDILYCTSNSHCGRSFRDYAAWLKGHCSASDSKSFLTYEHKKYDPPFAITVSYLLPRAWSESPSSVDGLKFSNGANLGDFDGNKVKSAALIDIDFATRVFSNEPSHWLNAIYLGLNFWGNPHALKAQGEFTYNRLSPANHYDYQYNISTKGVGLTGKFYLFGHHRIKPYVLIGLGAARLSTSGFKLTPLNDADATALNYAGKTKTNFYYNVALGTDYSINNHFRIGVNYFYSDLGKYTTGPGALGSHTTPALTKRLSVDGVAITAAFDF